MSCRFFFFSEWEFFQWLFTFERFLRPSSYFHTFLNSVISWVCSTWVPTWAVAFLFLVCRRLFIKLWHMLETTKAWVLSKLTVKYFPSQQEQKKIRMNQRGKHFKTNVFFSKTRRERDKKRVSSLWRRQKKNKTTELNAIFQSDGSVVVSDWMITFSTPRWSNRYRIQLQNVWKCILCRWNKVEFIC